MVLWLTTRRVVSVLIVVQFRHRCGEETELVTICAMHVDFTAK